MSISTEKACSALSLNQISNKKDDLLHRFLRQKWLMLMVIPGVIWMIIFNYLPMYGVIIAFQDFDVLKGYLGSAWVGLSNFKELFIDEFFISSFRNTLIISMLKLVVGFPVPIIFAILLNELRADRYKRFIQSISYLPTFISWVFVAGFLYTLFSSTGPINTILSSLHIIKEPIFFLGNESHFLGIVVLSDVWKGFGWGSVIYLANIVSIDSQLYEAAVIDGANRFQRVIHITLPSIKGTVVMLLILAISNIVNQNFDQMLLMTNPLTRDVGEIVDVYGYVVGIKLGRFSYSTAIGLFKSALAVILLLSANQVSKKLTGERLV